MRLYTFFLSLIILFPVRVYSSDAWQAILNAKEGELTFYWYPNNVNIDDSRDLIDGVEHDLAFAFADYLQAKYTIDLKVNWVQTNDFEEVLALVAQGNGGVFGASSISITKGRQEKFQFTPAYLADIAILVSSPDVPIAYSPDEFQGIFNELTAVTIKNTTFSVLIDNLRNSHFLNHNTEYVKSEIELLEKIESTENTYSYISLPTFLTAINSNRKIRRQFFYPIKLDGLAMIYAKHSDWEEPVNDYFNSRQFDEDKRRIILKYFGDDIGNLIDQISKSVEMGPFEEIMLSNREKELQYKELLKSADREREKNTLNNLLIILLGFVCFGIFFLIVSNRDKIKS